MSATDIVQYLILLGVMVAGWQKLRADARKSGVDVAHAISSAAVTLVNPMQTRIDELEQRDKIRERRLRELEEEIATIQRDYEELWDGLQRVVHQVKAMGQQPVYEPEPKRARKGSSRS